MKRYALAWFLMLSAAGALYAQLTFSGILDSTVSMYAGAGDSPAFSMGLEEYANVRFQARLREGAAISGAVNLFAVTGTYAQAAVSMAALNSGSFLSGTAYAAGEYYAAAIELERLHFRLNGNYIDFSGGLMRMPFGYGQVFGPSDFLNPKNPLKPGARLRAVLGSTITWYPVNELKLLGFFAAPRDVLSPNSREGGGSLFGISMDYHWNIASLQALYSYETPNEIPKSDNSSKFGIHRAGLSLKVDIEVGLHLDALYTYNHEAKTNENGLSVSAGADYTLFGGNLYILVEYLYNGGKSSTAYDPGKNTLGFYNNHYLYTGFTYRFSDFTSMNFTLISCFDDISFTPVVSVNQELFQGVTLTVTAQVPLDRDLFSNNGKRGEFGPIRPDHMQPRSQDGKVIGRYGSYFNLNAGVRIRF